MHFSQGEHTLKNVTPTPGTTRPTPTSAWIGCRGLCTSGVMIAEIWAGQVSGFSVSNGLTTDKSRQSQRRSLINRSRGPRQGRWLPDFGQHGVSGFSGFIGLRPHKRQEHTAANGCLCEEEPGPNSASKIVAEFWPTEVSGCFCFHWLRPDRTRYNQQKLSFNFNRSSPGPSSSSMVARFGLHTSLEFSVFCG